MRTTKLSLIAAVAATAFAACTVKDVDTPSLAGPSSLARTIIMQADRDTLVQDGVQEAAIRLTAVVQPGQSENVRLRAQVLVDGVAQDFGTLSNKNPITPTTIFYRAPAAPIGVAGQVPTTVTIAVTPDDQGDFRGEQTRTLDLQLIPPGVILPINPNLAANFSFAPATPQVMTVVTFNATGTTNNKTACGVACTYAWNFGDGTSASGLAVTHQFRTVGAFVVRLTATDNRGAQAIAVQTVSVAPGERPTVDFTFSPTPAIVDQAIFFNASASRPAPGRTIVSYDWDFGKGTGGTGITVSKAYDVPGTYTVTLKLTDDAGTIGTASKPVVVNSAQIQPAFTIEPAAPVVNQPVVVNASSSTSTSPIVSFSWNFGANATPATGSGVSASTQYSLAGSKVITLTVTDNQGRTASSTKVVAVTP